MSLLLSMRTRSDLEWRRNGKSVDEGLEILACELFVESEKIRT